MALRNASCRTCGKAFQFYTSKTRGQFCSKKCQHSFPYEGSVWLGKNGYLYFSQGRKRKQLLHRIIAGAKKGEIVHHRNGNRLDNRPENLAVLRGGHAEHIKLHNPVLARWAKRVSPSSLS